MGAGRPRKVDPGSLYAMAHMFYWELRMIDEGTRRWRFIPEKYQQLTEGLDELPLVDDEDRLRHAQIVDEEIRTGRLEPGRREERLRDIEDGELFVRRDSYRREAAEEARMEIKVPGERDVIDTLLDRSTTAEEVRALCKDALMTRTVKLGTETREIEIPAWPIHVGSTLPGYLSQYAEQHVAALNDPRFPRCDVRARPSTRLKQLWFISRALAGALFGVKTRTTINLVGSLRPEEVFEDSRNAKPERKRMRRKYSPSRTS
jgi:hypothetical protein